MWYIYSLIKILKNTATNTCTNKKVPDDDSDLYDLT